MTNYLKTTLETALGLKRPHSGKQVHTLINYLLQLLPDSYLDDHGNVHCTVGESRTLFSSHTDTVHREDGANTYVIAEESVVLNGKITCPPRIFYRAKGAPLGADCGAGVALMTHMIMNGLPGHYVFHAAEEVGGVGSGKLADSGVLKGHFDRAIAFDRKATYSVITHQARGQCCSDEFADALCDQLNVADDTFTFAPDDTGVYTDTAEYVDQIRECTNVSVGYYGEHTSNESLDYTFLEQLAAAVLLVKWEELPVGVIPEPSPASLAKWSTSSDLQWDGAVIYNTNPHAADHLDDLWCLADTYPEIFDEFTYEAIVDIANVLGEDGIDALFQMVNSGHYEMSDLQDALWDPQGFMNLVAADEKLFQENMQ
jgi:hypothetical protein